MQVIRTFSDKNGCYATAGSVTTFNQRPQCQTGTSNSYMRLTESSSVAVAHVKNSALTGLSLTIEAWRQICS